MAAPAVDDVVAQSLNTAAAGFWGQHAMLIGANAQNSSAVLNALQQQSLFNTGAIDSKTAANTPNQGGVGPSAPAAPK